VAPSLETTTCLISPSSQIENEPQAEQVAQLAQEVYNNDALQLMVQNIWRFEFEVGSDCR
jgi:hypothetical protein